MAKYILKQNFNFNGEDINSDSSQKKLADLYENMPHIRVYLIDKIESDAEHKKADATDINSAVAPKVTRPRKPRVVKAD
jgi:hypothetical protein